MKKLKAKPAEQELVTFTPVKLALPENLSLHKNQGLQIAQALQNVGHRCGDLHVLVLRFEPLESKGGIIIPECAQEKSSEGVVVAVGAGHLLPNGDRVPLFVKPGDWVRFSKYYGTETQIGNTQFLQLHVAEIEGAI